MSRCVSRQHRQHARAPIGRTAYDAAPRSCRSRCGVAWRSAAAPPRTGLPQSSTSRRRGRHTEGASKNRRATLGPGLEPQRSWLRPRAVTMWPRGAVTADPARGGCGVGSSRHPAAGGIALAPTRGRPAAAQPGRCQGGSPWGGPPPSRASARRLAARNSQDSARNHRPAPRGSGGAMHAQQQAPCCAAYRGIPARSAARTGSCRPPRPVRSPPPQLRRRLKPAPLLGTACWPTCSSAVTAAAVRAAAPAASVAQK